MAMKVHTKAFAVATSCNDMSLQHQTSVITITYTKVLTVHLKKSDHALS